MAEVWEPAWGIDGAADCDKWQTSNLDIVWLPVSSRHVLARQPGWVLLAERDFGLGQQRIADAAVGVHHGIMVSNPPNAFFPAR